MLTHDDAIYTPQHVGLLAGCSANYVLDQLKRGVIHGRKVPAGKGWRYVFTRAEAEQCARQMQSRRARVPGKAA